MMSRLGYCFAIGECTLENGLKAMAFAMPDSTQRIYYLCNHKVDFQKEHGKPLNEIEHFHKTPKEAIECMKKGES